MSGLEMMNLGGSESIKIDRRLQSSMMAKFKKHETNIFDNN